jgi:sugar phosphate isomerase/epimerase
MPASLNRRGFLTTAAAAGAALTAIPASAELPRKYQEGVSPWPLCMNTSTIRPASLTDKIRVTADAGWDAIELWIDDIAKHEAEGGNLEDLGKEIADRGLFVANVIGLWNCMPATQEDWEASLPETRERMRQSAAVGSHHVAAIPAPDREDFDLAWGAARYRDLLEMGQKDYGITTAFEFIGFLKGVHRLGQASAIALDANHPDACLVMDTFHLSCGGSGFDGVQHLNGAFIGNFHWNDVPADPPAREQRDHHRILPGDGVLPLTETLRALQKIGYTRTLSLELFNRDLWEKDPAEVSRIGLDKMRACIAKAL